MGGYSSKMKGTAQGSLARKRHLIMMLDNECTLLFPRWYYRKAKHQSDGHTTAAVTLHENNVTNP